MDARDRLAHLLRPKALVEAAHLLDQNRTRGGSLITSGQIAQATITGSKSEVLFELESRIDDDRRSGMATYSACSHIEILAELINEVRSLGSPHKPQL